MQRIKRLSKISFKSRMIIFFIIIIAVVGTIFGIYALKHKQLPSDTLVIAEQPIEKLIITATPSSDGAETITLFTTNDQTSSKSLFLTEGVNYTLTVESSFDVPSELTIYYNTEKIRVTENQEISLCDNTMKLSLIGEKHIQTDIVGSGDVAFFDGLTIENNDKYIAYAACSDFLMKNIANSQKTNYEIVLLNDIVFDNDLYITVPCNLLLNNKSLTINGDLIFNSELTGKFTVNNDAAGQVKVNRFFVEAINCDIEVKNDFFDFQDALGFYINAKSYNGTPLETNCRTVKSEEMLLMLLDDEQFPRLHANTKIVLDNNLALENNNLLISVPVSFQVSTAVSVCSPIVVKTYETGCVNIEITDNGKADNVFIIEAPNCDLSWSGSEIPSVAYVSEQMNVKTYNGEAMSQYSLGGAGKGTIQSFSLNKNDNVKAQEDLKWSISGNVIFVSVSYLVSQECLKNAVLDVKTENGTFLFNAESTNADNSINLLNTCTCTILDDEENQRIYSVRTERIRYNLPIVSLTVDDNTEVTSQEVYKAATISIDGSTTQHFPSLEKTAVNIRGRGNSTWKWDKKPYKLKFNADTSVLGLTAAKEWVLLSNYSDKTLIRNFVAMEMGKVLENIEFSPMQYPVDVFINGTYRGVYTMGEQIEADKGRVEIDKDYDEVDTGYLLEVGGAESAVDILDKEYFNVGTLNRVSVKSPNTSKMTQESFDYIKTYVSQADAAVVSLTNYEDYIDIDSLIDWFILHELTYNLDSGFRRSCFMTKDKGGKLKMGPIWDFDLAFGNFSKDNANYDDWATAGEKDGYVWITWMNYLLEDETFREKLQVRWDEIKDELLTTAITKIDEMSLIIEPSQQMNFTVWQIWEIRAGYSPRFLTSYNTYEKQIQYLKDFLYKRYEWMDENI